MNDELPEIFEHVRPVAAPTALRGRVLEAVEKELAPRRKPAWERALELGVAACLALGVGLNAWQWQSEGSVAEIDRASGARCGLCGPAGIRR